MFLKHSCLYAHVSTQYNNAIYIYLLLVVEEDFTKDDSMLYPLTYCYHVSIHHTPFFFISLDTFAIKVLNIKNNSSKK